MPKINGNLNKNPKPPTVLSAYVPALQSN